MRRKIVEKKNALIYSLVWSLAGVLIFASVVFAAKKNDLDLSAATEAQRKLIQAEMIYNEGKVPEVPMVEITANNGYWWLKQDYESKLNYVKDLLAAFKAKGTLTKLGTKELVKKLDGFYKPVDDPLDIHMDKSLEEVVDRMLKENVK